MAIYRLVLLLLMFYSGFVITDDDDINSYQRILVEQVKVNERLSKDKEVDLFIGDDLSINIDGQSYQVNNDVNDIGQAIYVALTRNQYEDVARFLPYYTKLTDHDDLLVKYANAKIAYKNKNHQKAINYYQHILQKNPDFLRIELELARVYYESQQNKEAITQFNHVLDKYA